MGEQFGRQQYRAAAAQPPTTAAAAEALNGITSNGDGGVTRFCTVSADRDGNANGLLSG